MKKNFLLVFVLSIVMFTGCKMGIQLDSKENDLIAEYAAGVVLLHSHYYDDRYDKPWMYEEETEEPTTEEPTTEEPTTEEPTTESPTDDTTESGDNNERPTGGDERPTDDNGEKPTGGDIDVEPPTEEPKELDLTEAFGTHPVEVDYVDYQICDRYDVNEFFDISPEENCKFLVLNFTLNNRSFEEKTISTKDKGVIMRLTVNGDKRYNNYDASVLMNDLTVLPDTKLASKEQFNAVILYMLPTDVIDSIDEMYIEVVSDKEIDGQFVVK